METRRIETPDDKRVESGPIVFDHCGPTGSGYDWPGVYLRGDLCGAMYNSLKKIGQHYKETAPGLELWKGVELSYLSQLMDFIEVANPNVLRGAKSEFSVKSGRKA